MGQCIAGRHRIDAVFKGMRDVMFVTIKKWLVRVLSPMPYSVKKVVYWVWCRTTAAGKIANKGERLVVSSWDELVGCGEFYHVVHAYRYYWAAQQIGELDRVILDLGCGSGYGAWYLASLGHHTMGYDVDVDTISWARNHFDLPGLVYLEGEEELNGSVDKYDVITCFEVLEHDPDVILRIIHQRLAPNGTLIISTPNADPVSVRQWLINNNLVTVNPAHVEEFTPAEFETLLRKHFNQVELFGQCVKGVYNYEAFGKWRRKVGVQVTDFEMRLNDFDNCEVVVAICKP